MVSDCHRKSSVGANERVRILCPSERRFSQKVIAPGQSQAKTAVVRARLNGQGMPTQVAVPNEPTATAKAALLPDLEAA